MSEDAAPYHPKLVHLPGTQLTPEVVLHRTLNKLEHIQNVTLIIEWQDGTMDVDWSQQKVSTLCMGLKVLDGIVNEVLFVKVPNALVGPPTKRA